VPNVLEAVIAFCLHYGYKTKIVGKEKRERECETKRDRRKRKEKEVREEKSLTA
jgi:hypothetical protein